MKIYLAARYSRREELCLYRSQLQKLGHDVQARWLNGGHQLSNEGVPIGDDGEALVEGDEEAFRIGAAKLRAHFANDGLEDVNAAECVISFTEAPSIHFSCAPNRPPSTTVEVWKPFRKSGYEASNLGRIRNAEWDLITGSRNRGYAYVKPDGKYGQRISVHSIVALLFIGERPEGLEIDHKDGDKTNNWVGNLEYVTHEENIKRAASRGAYVKPGGAENGRAKLTWDDVCEIRARAKNGESKADISRDYGVSDTNICNIVSGKSWRISDRGGRAVEFGIALGLKKRCIVIGYRENIFHWLPQVEFYENFDTALANLSKDEAEKMLDAVFTEIQ